MFRLMDGRVDLFQWDLDVKLIVEDPAVNQVHFCNRTDDCSLVCEVYEEEGKRVVNIPNILLQSSWPIRAYAYCTNHTKYFSFFKVYSRTKPADYVYTETEVLSFNTLFKKIEDIDASIAESVTDYLEKNPPKADLQGYATEAFVNNAISKINIPDISGLASTQYVDDKVAAAKPDLKGYATETFVNNAISKINIPDVSGLASTQYVDNKIAAANVTEEWVFTLDDGSTVTKKVVISNA